MSGPGLRATSDPPPSRSGPRIAASDRLARRYARWLWFCPPGPRRAEMLGTLLECAPPGRTRPTVRGIAALVRYGLRARLGRPASRSVVVFSVLVAFAAGLFGAAGAARIGWEFAPPLPSGAQAQALKATAFPGIRVYGGDDAEPFVFEPTEWHPMFGSSRYWAPNTAATRDVLPYAEGVRDRLVAAGWRIRGDITYEDTTDGNPPTRTAMFWATRDGLALYYDGSHAWQDDPPNDFDGAVRFDLSRSEAPSWLPVVAVAAGLPAALIGWLLFAWASRRSEGSLARTAFGACLAWPAVALTLFAVLLVAQWAPEPDRPGPEAFWGSLWMFSDAFAPLVLVPALGALIVAALPARVRAAAATALALAVLGMSIGLPDWVRGTCAPTGPPAPDGGRSNRAWVFLDRDATAGQRRVAEAAINRATLDTIGHFGLLFHSDPADDEYRDAYCDGRELDDDAGAALPHFWEVYLPSTDVFADLEAAVGRLPGVVAVRQD